ncbi:MAG: exodeoxyribonuclease VII small subunit [Lysobacterales bacterium]
MSNPPSELPVAASQVADFEHSLDELEALVGRMEKGEMSLDESLTAFERGVSLYRQCQGALEQAELRVRQLLDPTDPQSAVAFDTDTP